MYGLENNCNGKDAERASFVYFVVQFFKFFPHKHIALDRPPNLIQFSKLSESSLKLKKRVSIVNLESRI